MLRQSRSLWLRLQLPNIKHSFLTRTSLKIKRVSHESECCLASYLRLILCCSARESPSLWWVSRSNRALSWCTRGASSQSTTMCPPWSWDYIVLTLTIAARRPLKSKMLSHSWVYRLSLAWKYPNIYIIWTRPLGLYGTWIDYRIWEWWLVKTPIVYIMLQPNECNEFN